MPNYSARSFLPAEWAMTKPRPPRTQYVAEDAARRSFFQFLAQLNVEADRGHQLFGKMADQWQLDLASHVASGVEWLAGLRDGFHPKHQFFWIELPKAHNKTTFLAMVCSWLLCYSQRKLLISVCAAAQKQAGFIRAAMQVLRALNPTLLKHLRLTERRVSGPGGELNINASDEHTAQGEFPDLTIAEEVTVWHPTRGEKLWSTLHSNWLKRRGLFFVLSNAGYVASWQERRYTEALGDPAWDVFSLRGRHAGWLSDDRWHQQKLQATALEARRLYDNEWVGYTSDPLIHPEWIDAAMALGKERVPEPPYRAGVDVAPRGGDRNVIVVAGETGIVAGWEVAVGRGDDANIMRLVPEVEKLIRGKWEVSSGNPGPPIPADCIHIDSGGGDGVIARLRERGHRVVGEVFGSRAWGRSKVDKKFAVGQYANRRAELYGRLATLLDPDRQEHPFSIPPEFYALKKELCSQPSLYNSSGKLTMVAKQEIAERIGQSPDWADAAVLACWSAPTGERGTLTGAPKLVRPLLSQMLSLASESA